MKVEQLSKNINGKSVLNDINFDVSPGTITGLIGRNGAGKTTLLRTIVGIYHPSSGDVAINGKSVYTHPEVKQKLFFVPDSSDALKNYSTAELIRLYQRVYPDFDAEYLHSCMERFALPQVKRISHYSKGMKALFSLFVAFATKADYILLDEPTDGLDVIVKKQVQQLLLEQVSENGTSVIISSHRLDELEYMAENMLVIRDGCLDDHYELSDLKNRYKKIQAAFSDQIPEELENKASILNQTGRVYTLLMDNESFTSLDEIKKYQPLLLEELPLSLEDVFVAKFGGDPYV
ncbi:ABC transporter ATP-binding protein [Salisediminibacterium halotolerans]|uniref:ABC transporter ATP-binding protein n=1 Tax=Salisediminibacterium halotolerans TaxID=517425 RepID=UPI000EB46AE0|nr:ABC transporter ATP-binding protein [Salisediminibacterium halotolerans]RLJ72371.1 ABC-2 type transport system ATP-binding protein [Actinophytocola xinjiangensis]RPE85586.1 ABC-2 type transport system ATP-binding protein [Salisediminibacterium halotolerans]TWG33540.1 ABC-2 type transport system ATP-binding protein [Salisediminibacterium halotolerans]GEL08739.1 ABC transporter ATP-binding protein [Salisediminibacterium halotolerans]